MIRALSLACGLALAAALPLAGGGRAMAQEATQETAPETAPEAGPEATPPAPQPPAQEPVPQATRALSGDITYLTRRAPSPGSTIVVEFREPEGALLAETQAAVAEDARPMPFRLDAPEGKAGIVQAAVLTEGRPAWISDAVDVEAGTEDEGVGTLLLKPYEPVSNTHTFRCGDREIQVIFPDQRALLQVDDEIIELTQVESPSGARYATEGEPETSFWNKGISAQFTLRGERQPDCQVVLPVTLPGVDLTGPAWSVEGFGLLGFIQGARVTIEFDGGQVSGTTGCNTYAATYRLNGNALTIGPVATSGKTCTPELMDLERRFLDSIAQVNRAAIGPTGGLVLSTLTGASIRADR